MKGISVAIATVDRPHHVARAIAGLLADSEVPLEVLIIDQSENLETRAVVDAAASDLVRYVRHGPPGVSGARNRGAVESQGDYVAFLDDDCETTPGWVRTIRRELERFDSPDALWGEIWPPEGNRGRRGIPPVSTFEIQRARMWPARTHPNRLGYGGHMVVRRSTFMGMGGFDERLGPGSAFFGAEDMDLNYRLLRARARLASTPALRVIHHQWRQPADLPELFYSYNFGHSAFCAKHLRRGDARVLWLFAAQVRDDARMVASSVRRRSMLVAKVALWRVRGTWGGLAAGWRALADDARR